MSKNHISGHLKSRAGELMTAKKSFENFWYYHKNHVIIGCVLAVFVIIISYQMLSKTNYDNAVVVAGNIPATLADDTQFVKDISPVFKDVNGDGEVNINTTFIPFGGEIGSTTDAEMALAYPQQLQAVLAADDANIFIVTEDILISYGRDKAFADVSDIQQELGLTDCKYQNGILIKNRKLISALSLYDDVDYYIAVRINDGLSKLKGQKKTSYINAYNFMRELA